MIEHEKIEAGGRTFYVARNERGAGVLTVWDHRLLPFATTSLDVHSREPFGSGTTNMEPCNFLDGAPCYFDGTSCGPDVSEMTEAERFNLAETRLP